MIVQRIEENLAVVISKAATDDVAAGGARRRAVRFVGLGPFQFAAGGVQRDDLIETEAVVSRATE
jgi:hypothetical protein